MTELFVPLDWLLGCGGDARLDIEPASGVNAYGCRRSPCPDTLSFASSTATSISERAYDRVGDAREQLMGSAITVGLEAAFDWRVESMRDRLKGYLGLAEANAEIVFSPSGTDSQLQALFLTRALLGPALTTIIVAADQTGSGTTDTARGHHFSIVTSNGSIVDKGGPISGLADSVTGVGLRSFDAAGNFRSLSECDSMVLGAVERAVAEGANVLLQIMDSSKLGWRSPSDRCLDEISARWPDRVQVVVDACQMRLGRPRLRKYLDRGYLVIVTGSKFFTGPAFSGALLVPACLSKACEAVGEVASGLLDYGSRSDWPMHWAALRSHFPSRPNFGQWLRWEAALEEIRAYYSVPGEFRLTALTTFGEGVARLIEASPSLRLLPLPPRPAQNACDDEELAQATILPFVIGQNDHIWSWDECRKIYRALAREIPAASGCDLPQIPAQACLVGQPVALGDVETNPAAALRICASARVVTENWSPDPKVACGNLQRELDRVGAIIAKVEWLVAHRDGLNSMEPS